MRVSAVFISNSAASHIATSYEADKHEWTVLYYIAAFSVPCGVKGHSVLITPMLSSP
jgi:hypothetical protein